MFVNDFYSQCKQSTAPTTTLPVDCSAPGTELRGKFNQCGGLSWQGSRCCEEGLFCKYDNDYYWDCRPVEGSTVAPSTTVGTTSTSGTTGTTQSTTTQSSASSTSTTPGSTSAPSTSSAACQKALLGGGDGRREIANKGFEAPDPPLPPPSPSFHAFSCSEGLLCREFF